MATNEKSHRSRKILTGVFLILLSIFIGAGLFTYNTADGKDWHYVANKLPGYTNLGGSVGHFVARELFLIFGLVSYLLAVILGFCGILLIFRPSILAVSPAEGGINFANLSALFLKIFLLFIFIISTLTLAGLITPSGFYSGRMESLGGMCGVILSSFARHHFGSAGSYLLTFFILGTSAILATNWFAYDVGARILKGLWAIISRLIAFINSYREQESRKREQNNLIKALTSPERKIMPLSTERIGENIEDEQQSRSDEPDSSGVRTDA
ncbi:MAG: DNA translocase FtsK 4TM domain-containing protein, partial [Planctomycetota bacterium]|nr:DNA translocase FtsK 4TM domain-containing protein [Planctomycetota bacterium]